MVALAFALYLLSLIIIGVWSSKKASQGITDYFIGGRGMNTFVVALSAVVSGRSAWLLLGFTGLTWHIGIAAVWSVFGYIAVELWMFLYLAPRLRLRSELTESITLPDFLSNQFQGNIWIRVTAVLLILLFMTGYIAAQFVAGGKAFATGFGTSTEIGILTTAIVILLYTLLGGFIAVSITDAIQGFFMIICLLVLPAILVYEIGGIHQLWQSLEYTSAQLTELSAIGFGATLSALGIGLGSPGNPHILVRFMSIKNVDELKTAAVVGTSWNVLMATGALFIGLCGRILIPDISLLPSGDTETLYPYLAEQYLSPFLFGIVIASIFAAIMSTADSLLLVIASSVIKDFLQQLKGLSLSEKHLVGISRWTVFGFVLLALMLGYFSSDLIYLLVLSSWAGLGAGFGPALLFLFFYKKTTWQGIVAGMLSGAIITLVWINVPLLKAITYELIPAFLGASIAIWLMSIIKR